MPAMSAARYLCAFALAAIAIANLAIAAETEVALVIKNHRFEPTELRVPAGQRIKLVVHNQDSTPEEFESHSLNREKVIPGGREGNHLRRAAEARSVRLLW